MVYGQNNLVIGSGQSCEIIVIVGHKTWHFNLRYFLEKKNKFLTEDYVAWYQNLSHEHTQCHSKKKNLQSTWKSTLYFKICILRFLNLDLDLEFYFL